MSELFSPQNISMFLEGLRDTLYMVGVSALFSYLIGLPLGIILVVTDAGGIAPRRKVNALLGGIANVGRSIPFIILMLFLIPLTRAMVGSTIGPTAAIVSLVAAAAPFVARMVESSLAEIDSGVVEAAQTMGASNWQIVRKVLIPEAIPSLIRGMAITTITLVGYSAMAGAVGGGGLGDIAIRYGMHRYRSDVMLVTIVLLVLLVEVLQGIFNLSAKKIDKRGGGKERRRSGFTPYRGLRLFDKVYAIFSGKR